MNVPERRVGSEPPSPSADPHDEGPPAKINLGQHSAGSAAATIRKVGELLGYVVVASGPASFRLTKPVRRGIRRVDQVVTVSLTNDRDGLWVSYDGELDPRLVEQLEAEAQVDLDEVAAVSPAPIANLPRPERDRVGSAIAVRPGVAPQGLIDSVPGSSDNMSRGPATPSRGDVLVPGDSADQLPPPRVESQRGLLLRLPGGRTVSGDVGLVIGRDPELALQPRCRIRVAVDDLGVSKTHVAVWVDDDAIMIEDLHSTNGSEWVTDGEPQCCEAGRPVRVAADRLELLIGSATIVVERTT